MNCSRCNKPIINTERAFDDPCCGAEDCEYLTAVSHYNCLPIVLQRIEDEEDD